MFDWLWCRPDEDPGWLRIILWWEIRRIPYNLALALAGGLNIWLFFLMLPEEGDLGDPLLALFFIPLYALAANAIYTMTWITELRDRKVRPLEAGRNGTKLFKRGFLFSVLLTLIGPALLVAGLVLVGLLIKFL